MMPSVREAVINYDIDEYDERFLRHLALGLHQRYDCQPERDAIWREITGETTE